ncbi:MAG: hypothetical protein M0P74_11630 [Syntrophales bacterium]|nr:hypothetical protein [Syntrophales bacterium]
MTATDVEATNGAINIAAGGKVTATNVVSGTDAEANDITLQGTTIEAGAINAGTSGDVFLTATTGAITDRDGKITAEQVTASAAGAMTLDTTAAEILSAATSAAGAITITETDGLILTNVTASNGSISVTAGGAVTATNVVSATDADENDITIQGTAIAAGEINAGLTGDVSLSATAGAITDIEGKVTADQITISSVSGIALDTTATGGLTLITSVAGPITIATADGIVLTNVISADGPISVTAGGVVTAINVVSATDKAGNDITIQGTTVEAGVINAGSTGDVFLTATTGAITDLTGKITADKITAAAAGAMTLDTTATEILSATTSAAGAITITETDDIILTNVTSSNGPISVTAGGAVTATNVVSTTNNDANDITIQGATIGAGIITAGAIGDVFLTATAGAITDLDGKITAEQITASAAGAMTLDTTAAEILSATTSAAGAITITETDGIILTNVISADGPIDVAAGGTITATDLQSGNNGNLTLTAVSGDVLVNLVTAGSGTATIAAAGAIDETGGDAASDINAATIDLNASTGIGSAGPIELSGRTLTADTGAGAISLANTPDGSVTVQSLTTGNASHITYQQTGQNLTLAGSVSSAGGSILIERPVNLAVNADVETIGTGMIMFRASGDIAQAAGVTVSTEQGSLIFSGSAEGAEAAGFVMRDDSTVSSTSAGTITIRANRIAIDNVTTSGNVVLDANGAAGDIRTITAAVDGAATAGLIAANKLTMGVAAGDKIAVATNVASVDSTNGATVTINEADDLIVNTIVTDAGGALNLTAAGNITENGDATADITAGSANLIATTAGRIDVDTNVTTLAFSAAGAVVKVDEVAAGGGIAVSGTAAGAVDIATTDGSVTVNAAGIAGQGVTLTAAEALAATVADITIGGPVNAGVGLLALTAADGIAQTAGGTLTTLGNVQLTATAGSIAGNDNLIKTPALAASAHGSIAVDTMVETLEATAATGSVNIDEADDILLKTVNAAGGVDITLAKGSLTAGAVTGGAAIEFSLNGAAPANVLDDGDLATVISGTALTIDNDSGAGNLPVNGVVTVQTSVAAADIQATGDVRIKEADSIILTRVKGANAYIENAGNGNITITSINAPGLVSINSDGAIDNGTITAPQVALEADTGIGAAARVNLGSSAGTLLGANTVSGNVVIDAAGGGLTVGVAGGIAGVKTEAGNIRLDAGNLTVNSALTAAASGNIAVRASGSLIQSAAGDLSSNGGDIDAESLNGSITMADGALSRSSGGNIRYRASQNILVGGLDAGAGDVSVVSANGLILDAGDLHKDMKAAGLRMAAAIGIGTTANPLDIEVNTVAASSGSGGINLTDADTIEVGTVGPVTVLVLQQDGVLAPVTDAALTGLNATDGGSVVQRVLDGNIIVNAPISTTGAGEITLQAKDIAINSALQSDSISSMTKDGATFSWPAVSGAIKYYLEITQNGTIFEALWVEETSWTPAYELPPGSYSWTVRPLTDNGLGAASDPALFEIVPRIQAFSPAGTVSGSGLEFAWTADSGATRYQLIIDKDGAPFTQQWVDGLTKWTPGISFASGSYQWTVQPWSPAGFGLKSDPSQFTVLGVVGEAPSAFAPVGILTSGAGITFSWAPITGVSWYRVTILKDGANFASQYVNGANTWTPGFVFAAGAYSWTVQSWSPAGYGKLSDSLSFSITSAILPQASAVEITDDPGQNRAPATVPTASDANADRLEVILAVGDAVATVQSSAVKAFSVDINIPTPAIWDGTLLKTICLPADVSGETLDEKFREESANDSRSWDIGATVVLPQAEDAHDSELMQLGVAAGVSSAQNQGEGVAAAYEQNNEESLFDSSWISEGDSGRISAQGGYIVPMEIVVGPMAANRMSSSVVSQENPHARVGHNEA